MMKIAPGRHWNNPDEARRLVDHLHQAVGGADRRSGPRGRELALARDRLLGRRSPLPFAALLGAPAAAREPDFFTGKI